MRRGCANFIKLFNIRSVWLLACLLAACSGGSGPASGGINGPGGSLAGGNYASGPVDMSAPVAVNKSLIYCDNIAGPKVDCRGDNGAVRPNARVKITVYDRLYKVGWSFSSLFIKEAHALAGDTAFCFANGSGAFGKPVGPCSVTAIEGEKIGICISSVQGQCLSSELILTVGPEGTTTSGNTGTMKNLAIDPGTGNGFHSRWWFNPMGKVIAWVWNQAVPVAQAADAPVGRYLDVESEVLLRNRQIAQEVLRRETRVADTLRNNLEVGAAGIPSANASCPGHVGVLWSRLPRSSAKDAKCYVKQVQASKPNESENFIGIPTCENGQESIQKIRIYEDKAGSRSLAVAVDQWVYLIDIQQKKITRRVAFPYKVLDILPADNYLLVYLGGENIPVEARRIYTIVNNGVVSSVNPAQRAQYDTVCYGTDSDASKLYGLKEIVYSHHLADSPNHYLLMGGRFTAGDGERYKVLLSSFSESDEFEMNNFLSLYNSAKPLEAVFLGTNYESSSGKGLTNMAILDNDQKKIVLNSKGYTVRGVSDSGEATGSQPGFANPTYLDRLSGPDGVLDLGELSNLSVDTEAKKIAFINRLNEKSSQLVVVSYSCYVFTGCSLNENVAVTDLNFIPNILSWFNKPGDSEKTGWVVNGPDNDLITVKPTKERAIERTSAGQVRRVAPESVH